MTAPPTHRSLEDVFEEFKCRRFGILKALTIDIQRFYDQCDPEKENLCLFGLPDRTWNVNTPVDEVPPQIPEPILGINFARDGMEPKDWFHFVARHSDIWLLSVAFSSVPGLGSYKAARGHLFGMINELPTLFQIVWGIWDDETDKTSITYVRSSKRKLETGTSGSHKSSKASKSSTPGSNYVESAADYDDDDEDEDDDEDDDDEENEDYSCGACRVTDNWDSGVFCVKCERWFHEDCVGLSPTMALLLKKHKYECPKCSFESRED